MADLQRLSTALSRAVSVQEVMGVIRETALPRLAGASRGVWLRDPDEPVLRPRTDEDGVALVNVEALTFDIERAPTLQNDVDLIVFVWLLAVGLGGDEDVDPELEPG